MKSAAAAATGKIWPDDCRICAILVAIAASARWLNMQISRRAPIKASDFDIGDQIGNAGASSREQWESTDEILQE
jgi:hypothetical protein